MISWLNNLRLTLQQWLFVATLAAIAILMVILRIRTKKLHEARIDLLKANYGLESQRMMDKMARLNKRTQKARRAYESALSDYYSKPNTTKSGPS